MRYILTMNNPYQNYLSISENKSFHQQIQQVLGTPYHPPLSFDANILPKMEKDSPYVLCIDGTEASSTLSLIRMLRNRHPLANIPMIVIFPAQDSFGTKLSHYKNISALAIEDIESDLSMYLEIAIDEQFIDRDQEQPDSYSMEFFSNLWREGRSAKILLETSRSFSIHRGGVLSLSDIPALRKALYSSPPQYQILDVVENGDWISVGNVLWEEARKYCHPTFLTHRKWLYFTPTKHSFRALELPISLPTRKLLFSTDAEEPLLRRIRSLNLNIPQVEQDIEVLFLLGLYSFQVNEDVLKEDPHAKKKQSTPSQLSPAEGWDSWLEEGLLEQWTQRQIRNPWKALRFDPQKDLAEQLATRRENLLAFRESSIKSKQQKRYQQCLDHLNTSSRILAFSLHLYECYGYPTQMEDEDLFFEALSLLEERQSKQAVLILESLPKENPRYKAFLGWALFLSDNSEAKTAYELLSASLKGKKSSIFFATISCAIQVHLKQWTIAEKNIRHLITLYNTEQLRTLLWYCQSKRLPEKNWFSHG